MWADCCGLAAVQSDRVHLCGTECVCAEGWLDVSAGPTLTVGCQPVWARVRAARASLPCAVCARKRVHVLTMCLCPCLAALAAIGLGRCAAVVAGWHVACLGRRAAPCAVVDVCCTLLGYYLCLMWLMWC